MTGTVIKAEGLAYVLFAIDHCSEVFVGIHAASGANHWEALEPTKQGVARHYGSLDDGAATGLILRQDHRSNEMSGDFQRVVNFLGMTSSPAHLRHPEGNGVPEHAIKTLKEHLFWLRHFATAEELSLALAEIATLYSASWLRERHRHKPPTQIQAEHIAIETEAATGSNCRRNWRNALFVQVSGMGLAFWESGFWQKLAPERNAPAIARYQAEADRLTDVIDAHFVRNARFSGDEHTIADAAHFGWFWRRAFAGVGFEGRSNLARR